MIRFPRSGSPRLERVLVDYRHVRFLRIHCIALRDLVINDAKDLIFMARLGGEGETVSTVAAKHLIQCWLFYPRHVWLVINIYLVPENQFFYQSIQIVWFTLVFYSGPDFRCISRSLFSQLEQSITFRNILGDSNRDLFPREFQRTGNGINCVARCYISGQLVF